MNKVKDLLMEHFMNPRNVGEIADANAVGEVGNPLCGDIVRLYLKVKDNKIAQATFKTVGCRASIATSSILTEMVIGKTLEQALKFKQSDIAAVLGELPPLKMHCTKLAELAVQAAVGDYQWKTSGQSTLRDTVQERIRNPQEWLSISPSADDDNPGM